MLGRLLLLLAHELQLFVDLLRGLDSVGRIGLGRVGRVGPCRCRWRGRGYRRGFRRGDRGGRRVGLCGLGGWGVARIGFVIDGVRVGIGWSWSALAWGEDEFGVGFALAMHKDHVASGAIEECGQNLRWICGAIFPKDTLIGDASGDFHAGIVGDLAKNLVEAGIVRRDGKCAVSISDLGALWGTLLRSERNLRLNRRCSRRRRREGGWSLGRDGGGVPLALR